MFDRAQDCFWVAGESSVGGFRVCQWGSRRFHEVFICLYTAGDMNACGHALPPTRGQRAESPLLGNYRFRTRTAFVTWRLTTSKSMFALSLHARS